MDDRNEGQIKEGRKEGWMIGMKDRSKEGWKDRVDDRNEG